MRSRIIKAGQQLRNKIENSRENRTKNVKAVQGTDLKGNVNFQLVSWWGNDERKIPNLKKIFKPYYDELF